MDERDRVEFVEIETTAEDLAEMEARAAEAKRRRGRGPNSAECPDWGECVDEMTICDENGMVGAGTDRPFLCTGGHHVGFQRYYRCISDFHYQDGPMSPGIGFLPAHPVT